MGEMEHMGDTIIVTGLILTALPLKEYDRRVELLTKEKGRISAFAQGARKGTSALSACTTPFTFGEYTLYAGRSSYNLRAGAIQKYFGDIAADYDMTCYASYFAETAQYLTRENIEASRELLLLYVTLSAMQKQIMPLELVRIIFEMRIMSLTGQGIELFQCLHCQSSQVNTVYFRAGGLVCPKCAAKEKELARQYPFVLSPDALYTLQYILTAPLERLYSFTVSEEVLKELGKFMQGYLGRYMPHKFKTLKFLESI